MDRIKSNLADDVASMINDRLKLKEYDLEYSENAELEVETTRSTIIVLGADADHREQIVDLSTPDGTKPFHPDEITAVEEV